MKSMVNTGLHEGSCARTRKSKTSLNSFVGFRQSKSKNKKNLSSIFVEVSESFGIFEIARVFAEIFGFENLKFSRFLRCLVTTGVPNSNRTHQEDSVWWRNLQNRWNFWWNTLDVGFSSFGGVSDLSEIFRKNAGFSISRCPRGVSSVRFTNRTHR